MTKLLRLAALSFALSLVAGEAISEVVVLRGGTVVPVKQPPVRRGNNVLLTRMDGTLLSVPASEIDREATAAARSVATVPARPAAPAAAITLVDAARASREVPKARVRITDADVAHSEAATAAATEEAGTPKAREASGGGRVEVGDYTQEKSGEVLIVRGSLSNPGTTPAMNVRMTVSAVDAKGQPIASAEAALSAPTIDPAGTSAFTVSLPVGERLIGSIRFAPRWVAPAPPADRTAAAPQTGAPGAAGAAPAGSTAAAAPSTAAAPPPPEPTPYGRGTLYAPPAASAPSEAPRDGKSGYVPGASHPQNQPKPPN